MAFAAIFRRRVSVQRGRIPGLAVRENHDTMKLVAADAFINCRVTGQTKALVRALADQQGITESRLVKDLLEVVLHQAVLTGVPAAAPDRPSRTARLCVRLQPEDWKLLRARADGRRIPPATYVSLLVRSHLRGVAPLPKKEYLALKQSVAELSMIGRNLNQIARAANFGQFKDLSRAGVDALLRACVRLRDAMKELINTNLKSWESGDEEKTS